MDQQLMVHPLIDLAGLNLAIQEQGLQGGRRGGREQEGEEGMGEGGRRQQVGTGQGCWVR